MGIGLVGKKCGMTRVFKEDGCSIPVSVIKIDNNRVSQIKTIENDGYNAIQVAYGDKKNNLTKSRIGHIKKAGLDSASGLYEFRVTSSEVDSYEIGSAIDGTLFELGSKIDVIGITIGKGFAGGVKRHNFKMQDATHGNSLSHRAPGSIGQCQTPGRVFKGKKMAGHMGARKNTIQNLEVVRIDLENGVLLVKGAVPGSKGSRLIVSNAVKARKANNEN
ncbi:MAG: 50S ribosomal protein L3 [Methylococcales bacterium]|nr:50S ribosomal protein L3 [Methylococcales bacterium]